MAVSIPRGPDAGTFNESNEVRLHGNEVLKDFWSIDFSVAVQRATDALLEHVRQRFPHLGQVQLPHQSRTGTGQTPVERRGFPVRHASRHRPDHLARQPARCCRHNTLAPAAFARLDIAGYVAINALRIVAPKGRQIVYLPGDIEAFKVLETATDMHFWMLLRMNKNERRRQFMTHFSQADRQQDRRDPFRPSDSPGEHVGQVRPSPDQPGRSAPSAVTPSAGCATQPRKRCLPKLRSR